MKEIEIRGFACMFHMDEGELGKIYEQISKVKSAIIFRSELKEDEVIVGELDDFERKAIVWAYKQTDYFLTDLVLNIVFTRAAMRLNLKCTFSLKNGGKLAVKKEVVAAHYEKLLRAPVNGRECPI